MDRKFLLIFATTPMNSHNDVVVFDTPEEAVAEYDSLLASAPNLFSVCVGSFEVIKNKGPKYQRLSLAE